VTEAPRPSLAAYRDIKVWDPLLRLTHWSFPLLIPAMWWTAENDKWALHQRLGLVLLGLLASHTVGLSGPGNRALFALREGAARGDCLSAAWRS